MELTRLQIILILGLGAFALRALPQLYFVGRGFPESWDRLLRYLSYAFLCSIIAITLLMSGAQFESNAALPRMSALVLTVAVARWRRSAVTGMLAGLALIFSWTWLP
jgi:branched-subunit amino acid transport protein